MKIIYLTIIALLLFVEVRAQEASRTNPSVLAFKKFLERRTLPSAEMRERDIQGLVIVGVKIDSNKKINNLSILTSSTEQYNSRAMDVLKSYGNDVLLPPGQYAIVFEFLLLHGKPEKEPIPYDKNTYPNFLFEVDIIYSN